jgi:organic radical activating enzyme
MYFDKNLNLKGFCHHPFNTISIDGKGDVYVCICQAWLPISVGKIWEFDHLNEILNTPNSLAIQNSIIDGSYRYCDHKSCSLIQENQLSKSAPALGINWINFVLDDSCNLTCPSCRTDFRFIKEHSAEYNFRIGLIDKIIQLIYKHDSSLKFTLSGDGDPFASLIYRYFITNLDLSECPNVEIEIVTNGILLQDFWPKISRIHNNLVRTKISFDAGSESVYDITRKGGNWKKLLDNVKYLVNWRNNNNSSMMITSNFVVQNRNYLDMKNYLTICDQLGVDEINFQSLQNWGTFENFNEQNVCDPMHSNYNKFLSIIRNESFRNKKVNFTNLSELYNEITRTYRN